MKRRTLKKAVKNSSSFLTFFTKEGIFCSNESDEFAFCREGMSISNSIYLPYKYINHVKEGK